MTMFYNGANCRISIFTNSMNEIELSMTAIKQRTLTLVPQVPQVRCILYALKSIRIPRQYVEPIVILSLSDESATSNFLI